MTIFLFQEYELLLEGKDQEVAFAEASLVEIQTLFEETRRGLPHTELRPPSRYDIFHFLFLFFILIFIFYYLFYYYYTFFSFMWFFSFLLFSILFYCFVLFYFVLFCSERHFDINFIWINFLKEVRILNGD